jgi:peptide-methionine (S)-S-oxide reductase
MSHDANTEPRMHPPAARSSLLAVATLVLVAATPRAPRTAPRTETAVFAAGCFWGVQAVFHHVRGVQSAISGYAGGEKKTADYETVSEGMSGHAESVRVMYDPSVVTFAKLLEVFFSVAHDPTQKDRQGPDVGKQYRSAIFYTSEAQRVEAVAYIRQLDSSRAYRRPVVTEVTPLKGFYEAESYHQDYATRHPDDPYIVYNDAPKVATLKRRFATIYVER